MYRRYIDLNTIYKEELVSENYKINKVNLSVDEVRMEMVRNRGDYWLVRGLKPKFDYIRLIKKGLFNDIMMSDTPMERNTNSDFLQYANGDVLIFGLGLGLIVFPLLNDSNIKSITIVELYQDLIDIVEPKIKEKDTENKVTILQGDCFTYNLPKEKKFDSIYFDIWINISLENYDEQKKLNRKYSKNLNRTNPNSFMGAWMRDYYIKEKRKEKRLEKQFYGF